MKNLRSKLKKISLLKITVLCWRTLRNKHSARKKISLFLSYFRDYKTYLRLDKNTHFKVSTGDLYPCVYDKTETTQIDPVYFYQDAWCAGKIFKEKPDHHYDIASQAHMIGIISEFVPTTMIDIRPITLTSLPNLFFKKGDILNLPFKDGEIKSLSSICVVEHIGLGRYGDPLDTFGSEKALKEMIRVLAPGGNLYISVPVDVENKVYFNAHRAFTRNYLLDLFKDLKLKEEKYIYGDSMFDSYDQTKGFGTGLYHLTK